jgi:hypothetical protein
LIFCEAHLNGRRRKYIKVDVRSNHELFSTKGIEPTSISTAVGCPIITWRRNLNISFTDEETFPQPIESFPAAVLNLDIKILSENWGGFETHDLTELGFDAIFVVRLDRQPITIEQVKTMVNFCSNIELGIRAEKLAEEGLDLMTKRYLRCKFLKENVTKDKFEEFSQEFAKNNSSAAETSETQGARFFMV